MSERFCWLCGAENVPLERHHIFNGAYRSKSEKYGLVVYLCHSCHNEPPYGVHHNAANMRRLKKWGQIKCQTEQNWDILRFRQEFGKNYL